MHSRLHSLLTAAALGLALLVPAANAQLLLSGSTTGSFVDPSLPNTTVTNTPTTALFSTGIPDTGSFQTSILFQNSTFVNAASGDPIQVGAFTITNGVTLLGSAAATATFNLGLQLTSPVATSFGLTQFVFAIDNTPNGPGGVPDSFGVSFVQPAPIWIDGTLVTFHVVYEPSETVVPEGSSIVRGDIYATFSPVPEPSTYALWGSALLIGVVAWRRFRPSAAPDVVALT